MSKKLHRPRFGDLRRTYEWCKWLAITDPHMRVNQPMEKTYLEYLALTSHPLDYDAWYEIFDRVFWRWGTPTEDFLDPEYVRVVDHKLH